MLGGLKKILFWTYPRGCWQYDLAVAAILAFIFLTPRSVFDGSAFKDQPLPTQHREQTEPQQQKNAAEPGEPGRAGEEASESDGQTERDQPGSPSDREGSR